MSRADKAFIKNALDILEKISGDICRDKGHYLQACKTCNRLICRACLDNKNRICNDCIQEQEND